VERVLVTADPAEGGLAFIYRALDALVSERELHDALVVLDEPPLGRQAFLAGRRLPADTWSAWHVAHARPGVHTLPVLVDGDTELAAVAGLCRLALRLELARYDAQHDALTGLRNRRSFEEALAAAASRSARYGWPFSLVLVDLDGFKRLNDRLGHDAGDAVLRAVGEVARRSLRQGDVAARLGGDEFAFILPSVGGDAGFVPALVTRLQAGLDEVSPTRVRFSVGVAVCPADATDPDTLRRIADERLLAAKSPRRAR
jgi:diguanylate cyclase (GGDEF)-like protein